jgi:hypothetical protein
MTKMGDTKMTRFNRARNVPGLLPLQKRLCRWPASLLALLALLAIGVALLSWLGGEGAVLAQAARLQEKARLVVHGPHPDGMGRLTLITRKGRVEAHTGLDPMLVFGNPIKVADLLTLLRARAEANRTGGKGPMSADASDLCFVCLYTLPFANDPESVPVIAQLLTDRSPTIRGWAAIALYRLGNKDEQLRERIKTITFPKSAVDSAAARGENPPAWVKTGNGTTATQTPPRVNLQPAASPASAPEAGLAALPGNRLSIEEAVSRPFAFAVACEAMEDAQPTDSAQVKPGT